jgi:hypothetical protein
MCRSCWPVYEAADRWERFEMPWEHAQALLGKGRCLLTLGQPTQASSR